MHYLTPSNSDTIPASAVRRGDIVTLFGTGHSVTVDRDARPARRNAAHVVLQGNTFRFEVFADSAVLRLRVPVDLTKKYRLTAGSTIAAYEYGELLTGTVVSVEYGEARVYWSDGVESFEPSVTRTVLPYADESVAMNRAVRARMLAQLQSNNLRRLRSVLRSGLPALSTDTTSVPARR